ncbi:TIR domain-containing protein [Cetobacterium sp.]|uniref:TIR domain-containing protein n=1 Tax=Cetobacterium sp. TaxID=2071632 RepID=UPI003F39846C
MEKNVRTKIFISFYFDESEKEKKEIENILGEDVINKSVQVGEIKDNLTDEEIRKIIRDEYLKDSTVTIILVGKKTKERKHVDWEIYASMYDKKDGHTKSGILIIDLNNRYWLNSREVREKCSLPLGIASNKELIEKNTLHFPSRLIKNILKDDVKIRIATYSEIKENKEYLLALIEEAKENRFKNNYDISDKLKRQNG